MSCMLRIGGKKFNITLLEDSHVEEAYNIWKKGTRKIQSKKHSDSGISFLASDAEFENFDEQKSEVIQFLKAKKKLIRGIMKLPDIDYADLDFGIEHGITEDTFLKSFFLPSELVKLAGSLDLGIELSLYSSSEELD